MTNWYLFLKKFTVRKSINESFHLRIASPKSRNFSYITSKYHLYSQEYVTWLIKNSLPHKLSRLLLEPQHLHHYILRQYPPHHHPHQQHVTCKADENPAGDRGWLWIINRWRQLWERNPKQKAEIKKVKATNKQASRHQEGTSNIATKLKLSFFPPGIELHSPMSRFTYFRCDFSTIFLLQFLTGANKL